MASRRDLTPRVATVDDAAQIAKLLHDFNTEFDTPTPGVSVLTERLRRLLAGPATFAVVAGRPAVALALVTLRSNVWYSGPVALLDEMYVAPSLRDAGIGSAVLACLTTACLDRHVELVEIGVDEGDIRARRFYERHGFSSSGSDDADRALYYSRPISS